VPAAEQLGRDEPADETGAAGDKHFLQDTPFTAGSAPPRVRCSNIACTSPLFAVRYRSDANILFFIFVPNCNGFPPCYGNIPRSDGT
jgi:hypothetical protein